MTKVSIVIPCYRSAHTIEGVIQEIHETLDPKQIEYECILVNDCSPDNTLDVLKSMQHQDSKLVVVDLAKNFGQHAALMAGFHQVTGDVVVCLDDDGQTPANEMGKLLSKLEEGYDVVYASYANKQHSSFRNFGSYLNGKMTEMMLGKPKELQVTSYFACKRFIVDEMIRYSYSFPYVIGLVLRSTKNICNVPVTHRQRTEGTSGYSLQKLINLWMNGFTSFSIKPLRIATYLGCSAAFIGFLYMIVIIVRHFVQNAAPAGWASTNALILVMGGLILVVLGMIGEYVGRIYMCCNNAPQYVIRKVIK